MNNPALANGQRQLKLHPVHPEDRALLGSNPSAVVNSNTAGLGGASRPGRPPAGSTPKRKIPGVRGQSPRVVPDQNHNQTRGKSALAFSSNRLFTLNQYRPKADIGWTGNWGMAASAEERDYVHLVTHALSKDLGRRPEIMVRNIADFERNYASYDVDGQLRECFDFDPDLVILAIGENVPALASEEAKSQFQTGLLNILRCALARRHPLIVVRSSFWPDAAKDQVLRDVSVAADAILVDAGPIGKDPANAARAERPFQHDGVAAHPGDRGMQALADAIVRALRYR